MQNGNKPIESNIEGVLLSNGDFLFSSLNDVWRKMVLVTNKGVYIKHGYVRPHSAWYDVNTWRDDDHRVTYSLTNFQGRKGETHFFILAPPLSTTSITFDQTFCTI